LARRPARLESAHGSEAEVKPKGPWTPEEIARAERSNRAQVARDRARPMSTNLKEAAALARFANRFAQAFSYARSA
jgi:hypothetical protein